MANSNVIRERKTATTIDQRVQTLDALVTELRSGSQARRDQLLHDRSALLSTLGNDVATGPSQDRIEEEQVAASSRELIEELLRLISNNNADDE